jgi:hypothetical protein
MFWEILWALILGFALSGAVQAVVSKQEMRRLRTHTGHETRRPRESTRARLEVEVGAHARRSRIARVGEVRAEPEQLLGRLQ